MTTPMTPEMIAALPRADVRYALFRARSGVPDADHQRIIDYYMPRLTRYGLAISEFHETWDISKQNNLDIVSGHVVHLYREEVQSLFNADGSLKE